MKKFMVPIIILLFVLSVQAAYAKIGYVDMRKIVAESNQGKEARQTLDSIEKAKKALMKEKIIEIRKLEEDFSKQGSILNDEAKEKKKAEIEKLMVEYQQMRRESEGELQKTEAEFVQKIVLEVRKLLSVIAKEEGYTAILDKAGVVYMPDEFDLTDRVIKKFNESAQKDKPEQ